MNNNYKDSSRRILIIGGGMAGLSAAKAARAQDPRAEITIISAESRLPYYRLRICEYIGQNVDYDKLLINNEEWFEANSIRVELSTKVTAVDGDAKKITANGKDYSYDSLVIATGSTPIIPPFTGKDLLGVHTLWTYDDVVRINSSLEGAKKQLSSVADFLGLKQHTRFP